jgi:hypothetical protein
VKNHGAIVDLTHSLKCHDISGITLVREVYSCDYPHNAIGFALYSEYYWNFPNTIVGFLDYLYTTDTTKTIDWYSYRYSLFRIAYNIGDIATLELFRDRYRAEPSMEYCIRNMHLDSFKLVREVFSDFTYPKKAITLEIYNNSDEKELFRFLDYIRETDTSRNIIWNDERLLSTAVQRNILSLVKYYIERLDLSYNIYEIDFTRKLDILTYLLERMKPEESPLLNSNNGWLVNGPLRRVVDNIDLDLPGFRPIIYLDNTNYHPILKKKCKRKRDYLAYRDRLLVNELKQCVEKDVAKYIISRYL